MRTLLAAIFTCTACTKATPLPPPPDPPAPAAPSSAPSASGSETPPSKEAGGGLAALAADAAPEAEGMPGRVNPIRDAGDMRVHYVNIVEVKATPPIADAERVVTAGRPRYRLCYQQGLEETRSIAGELTIAVKVGADGEVTFADVTRNTGLSPSVASCAVLRTKHLTFSPPQGGVAATMTIKLKMGLQTD